MYTFTTSSNTCLMYFTYFDKSDFKNVNAATQQFGKRPWQAGSNSRLRRSRRGRKNTKSGLAIRFNPIKARIHVGQSKKSIQISCNAAQDSNGRYHKICKTPSKDFISKYLLQECFPIKTEADYNEVSQT